MLNKGSELSISFNSTLQGSKKIYPGHNVGNIHLARNALGAIVERSPTTLKAQGSNPSYAVKG